MHPTVMVFDDAARQSDGRPGFFVPYFSRDAIVMEEQDYIDETATLTHATAHTWLHRLSDIISGLINAGLQIDWLHEHDGITWQMFKHLVEGADGVWRWPDKECNNLRPADDVGKPPDRAPRHEHLVEARGFRDRVARIVKIGVNETGAIRQSKFTRQYTRRIDGWFREVQPGDGGTALRQDQCVTSEMALQVKYPLSGDRTQFAFHDSAELAVACPQVIKAIAAWPSMQRDQLVPVRPVDRSPVLSGHFVSFPSSKMLHTPRYEKWRCG
jgi:hypothetical protein